MGIRIDSSKLISVILTTGVLIAGCGPSSDAPSPSSSADLSPEQVCQARSLQLNLQGESSEVVSLTQAAVYDDCMVPNQASPQQAAKERKLGQLAAVKGTLAVASESATGGAKVARNQILATADLDQLFALLMLLKASGKFSEGDLMALDQTFPHLKIGDAFRAYEEKVNSSSR